MERDVTAMVGSLDGAESRPRMACGARYSPHLGPLLAFLLLAAQGLPARAAGGPAPGTLDLPSRSVACALLAEGVDDVAAVKLREIIAADGRFAFDRINLAVALLKRADNEAALAALDEAQRLDGSYPQATYLRGLACRRLRRFPEALRHLAAALEKNPTCLEALFQIGLVHEWQDRLAEAKKLFTRLLDAASGRIAGSPVIATKALFLGNKHLSILASTQGDDRAGERHSVESQKYAGANPPQDSDLDLGPCADPVEPTSREAAAELARAGVTLATTPTSPSLDLVPVRWPLPESSPAASVAVVAWTTSGPECLWADGTVFSNGPGGWKPGAQWTDGSPIAAADLDGDARYEAVLRAPGRPLRIRPLAPAAWQPVELPRTAGAAAVLAIDHDQDGDLDLLVATAGPTGSALTLFLNKTPATGSRGPVLEPVPAGASSLSSAVDGTVVALAAGDVDDSNDLDVVAFRQGARPVLFLNRRQGRFDRREIEGPPGTGPGVLADVTGDGTLDVALPTASGVVVLAGRGDGRFAPARLLLEGTRPSHVQVSDLDADTWPDLVTVSDTGVVTLLLGDGVSFHPMALDGVVRSPPLVLDLDGDGALDLVLPGRGVLACRPPAHAGSIRVTLSGTSGKSDLFGVGALLRVRVGTRLVRREVEHPAEVVGLGRASQADFVRVQWSNGVAQNWIVLRPDGSRTTAVPSGTIVTVIQPRGLSGSCPYLYADRGAGPEFVTDVLAGAPLGLPGTDGRLVPTCPDELVLLPRGSWAAVDGRYRLRVTEEYREVTYLDHARLWVVDHDPSTFVFADHGLGAPPGEPKLLAFDRLQAPLEATTSAGVDVTDLLARTDGRHVEPPATRIQGVAPEHHVELAFPAAGADRREWLVLDGFIYWTDAGLNTRLAQIDPAALPPPRLEVVGPDGRFRAALPFVRIPAGRSKTAVVEVTGLLHPRDRRLRLVGRSRVYLDRVALASMPLRGVPVPEPIRLSPDTARLVFHGLAPLGPDPDRPPWFLVSSERLGSLEGSWLVPTGSYTRFGDVLPLVDEYDDRYVVMGPGDGVDLAFTVPPARPGLVRDLLVELAGYDKDAHPATFASATVEPLPYRGMPPYGAGAEFPPSIQDRIRKDHADWNTRFRTGWGGALQEPERGGRPGRR